MTIRPYQPSDRARILDITEVCFEPVSIDRNIERKFGPIGGRDWAWRKRRAVAAELDGNPQNIFVADMDGACAGYVTTRIDTETKIGVIPNLAVDPAFQKHGLGRKLIDTAVAHARAQGMLFLKIETLDQNAVGARFYPAYGFTEVARQIHYVMPL
jgi:ribosomal protein S18 acetylase RimI-like enzyme